jgi:hypothetical protein
MVQGQQRFFFSFLGCVCSSIAVATQCLMQYTVLYTVPPQPVYAQVDDVRCCTLERLYAQLDEVHQSTCPSYCIHAYINIIVK